MARIPRPRAPLARPVSSTSANARTHRRHYSFDHRGRKIACKARTWIRDLDQEVEQGGWAEFHARWTGNDLQEVLGMHNFLDKTLRDIKEVAEYAAILRSYGPEAVALGTGSCQARTIRECLKGPVEITLKQIEGVVTAVQDLNSAFNGLRRAAADAMRALPTN